MLPTITSTKYQHAKHVSRVGVEQRKFGGKKPRSSGPWSLLVLLVVSTLVMVYTKYSSLQNPHSRRRSSNSSSSSKGGSHEEDSSSPAFHHDAYLNLPPLPVLDAQEKTGSWKLTQEVYDTAIRHPNAKVISFDNPRLVLFPSFLTAEETDHFINLARKDLKRSHVVADTKDDEVSNARTSFGAWPPHDDFTRMVEERIHRLVGIPREFGEGMYVLNYKQGQEYQPHNDNCKFERGREVTKSCQDFLKRAGGPECGPGHGGVSCGDRIATVIIVLDPAEEGGHTAFPKADITKSNTAGKGVKIGQGEIPWYCSESYRDKVLQVAPTKGDAVLFWDYKPLPPDSNITPEQGMAEEVDGSQHSGCPVVKGEKWIVTRWIRSSTFK